MNLKSKSLNICNIFQRPYGIRRTFLNSCTPLSDIHFQNSHLFLSFCFIFILFSTSRVFGKSSRKRSARQHAGWEIRKSCSAWKFSSLLKQKIVRVFSNNNRFTLLTNIVAIYRKNQTKHTNKLCGERNVPFWMLQQLLTCSDYSATNGSQVITISFIKYQRDATFSVYLVFYNSICFGRSLRPSSGVILQTVVAATGVYHRRGVE